MSGIPTPFNCYDFNCAACTGKGCSYRRVNGQPLSSAGGGYGGIAGREMSCPWCAGQGYIFESPTGGSGLGVYARPCPHCRLGVYTPPPPDYVPGGTKQP